MSRRQLVYSDEAGETNISSLLVAEHLEAVVRWVITDHG